CSRSRLPTRARSVGSTRPRSRLSGCLDHVPPPAKPPPPSGRSTSPDAQPALSVDGSTGGYNHAAEPGRVERRAQLVRPRLSELAPDNHAWLERQRPPR